MSINYKMNCAVNQLWKRKNFDLMPEIMEQS